MSNHSNLPIYRNRELWYGIILFVLAAICATYWRPTQDSVGDGFREAVITTLTALASSLILIVLIDRQHLSRELRRTAVEIVEGSKASLNVKFQLLAACDLYKLIGILPPRQDEKTKIYTHEVIRSALSKAKTLDIIGVSLNDFLRPHGGASSCGEYYSELQEFLERPDRSNHGRKGHNKTVRVLLLDPNSKAAQSRSSVETIDRPHESIKKDVSVALDGIEKLKKSALGHGSIIKYKHYDSTPQMWAVITDKYVFVEFYHSAEIGRFCAELEKWKLPASKPNASCTGGRVPVLQFEIGSSMYTAVKCHFDTLWPDEKQIALFKE